MQSDERRLVPRYELALPVHIGAVRGISRNLSLEGVLFTSATAFARGEQLSLTVFIGGRANEPVMRVEARGEVVRSESEGPQFLTAVRFELVRVLSDAPRGDLSPSAPGPERSR